MCAFSGRKVNSSGGGRAGVRFSSQQARVNINEMLLGISEALLSYFTGRAMFSAAHL
jgi:hypothetical protein